MAENNLDVRTKWIKYTLMCITTLLMLSSALIIIVGLAIYVIYYEVVFFLYNNFFNEAIFTIVIGVIILFVSLFGFISALKKSIRLVNWFTVMLSIVLVLELYAAISAFSMREQVYYMLADSLQMFLPDYYQNHEAQDAFDLLQSGLHCCGVKSYMDWNDVPPPDGASGIVYGNLTVPHSCCEATSTNFDKVQDCTMLNAQGCLIVVNYFAHQTAVILGVTALTVGFIQINAIVLTSFSLIKSIRRAMSERCEVQERLVNHYSSIDTYDEKKTPFVYRLFSIGPFSLVCTKDLV